MDYESDPGWQYLRRSRDQILEDQSKPYDSKKNVWMSDSEEGYVAAEIKSTKGDSVTVVINGGVQKTVRKDEIQEMNPPKFEKTEDMSNLTFLNDASVLYNLRARYSCMLIYTYSGLFCVVINPYKRLPIYTDSVARMFMGKRRTEMPPHLFAVSDEAYRSMLQNHTNQSMLITGESGAGKTENTKKVIAYFASVGASQQEKERAAKGEGAEPMDGKRITLEDQIVQTNPVLEAFDLLEKSRVIRQAPGERCYHIFYQIFSGYRSNLIKELLLDKPPKEYYFIAQAEMTIDGIDDREEHQLTDEAFRVLNFSEDEIRDCYKLVAAIMHMGNMKFKQRPREEQAETDGTDDAEKASKMYGVATEDFLKALLRPRVKVGTEWVNKGQNMEQVAWSVGAMAKGLYSRMFNWLVTKCNITLTQKGTNKDFFIGVLDIAGFEIFDFNSFEQLWINFVNEKLQQFFNHHMFVLEQEEYAREGIEWVFIDFGLDLQACIELIEKPLGIIAMLDEECIVPKATDQTLAQKLLEQHLGKHPNFEKPKPPKGKQAEAHFAMRHYAGTVRYNVSNWLEKNKDPLNDTLVTVMKASVSNKLLIEIWSDYTTQEEALAKNKGGEKSKKKGKSGSFMTVSMIYRESLNNLMTMLNTTHPHFIRCIIPNEKKQSGLIDASLVLNQLTCNGVLEGIRICRKGFPNRTFHLDFVQRYTLLAPEEARTAGKDGKNAKSAVEKMLKRLVTKGDLSDDKFRVGVTKVFFKAGVVAQIEDLRDLRLSYLITCFQAQIRWYLSKIQTARLKKQVGGVVVIQKNVRCWLQLHTWVWYRLYTKVKPLLAVGKEQEELDAITEQVSAVKEKLMKEREKREQLEAEKKKIAAESLALEKQLGETAAHSKEAQERFSSISEAKERLERETAETTNMLANAERELHKMQQSKKSAEAKTNSLKKNITELDLSLKKAEAEKQTKQNQVRSLEEESRRQEVILEKINREKKQQQEAAKKLLDEVKIEEERNSREKSALQKMQNALESAESELDREKRLRSDMDKAKRKLDGELRIARETLEEVAKQQKDYESSVKRKESELFALKMRLESAQSSGAKSSRISNENTSHIKELEAELEAERQSRERSERAKSELQYETDELQEQLDQINRSISAQIEANKKKDAEIQKVRREIEQLKKLFENQSAVARKKGADACAEINSQIEQLNRVRTKNEKEKSALQRQLYEANLSLDDETKQRVDIEKNSQALEAQLTELRLKMEDQDRQIQDLTNAKNRLQTDNAEFTRQLDDLESKIANESRLKNQFIQRAEELKRSVADEARELQSMKSYSKNLLHELEQLRESLEDEIASHSDTMRQLSREQSEAQQWRSRFESQDLVADEDAEEVRKRQLTEITQLQNELDETNARLATLERHRVNLIAEAENSRADADELAHEAQVLEKQQFQQDKTLEEWRRKCEDLQSEYESAQREARQQKEEAARLHATHDETADQVDNLRQENKKLFREIHDLREQISETTRNNHDLEAAQSRLEIEKDELQRALDEAEAALEAEESKVIRSQVEVAQIRAEIEKRLQEKEEEFENIRKNHSQTMESMQSSLDQETRVVSELQRIKQKLESDISEFHLALEHATRANEDAQKNARQYQERVKELQHQIEEEQRKRDEFHNKFLLEEKRLSAAKNEQNELRTKADNLQRSTKQLEVNISELQIQNNELNDEIQIQASIKKKVEADLVQVRAEVNEAMNELRSITERNKNLTAETSRTAEELNSEQQRSIEGERQRKILETQAKDLQKKIDEIEQAAYRGGAKATAKLENQLKTIENELENEQRRHADTAKNLNKAERRGRELQFQVEEEKKNYSKLCELVEQLQSKIKGQRRLIEEAENSANLNLQKFRTVQVSLDTAQERADSAESNLIRVRSQSRVNLRGSGTTVRSRSAYDMSKSEAGVV